MRNVVVLLNIRTVLRCESTSDIIFGINCSSSPSVVARHADRVYELEFRRAWRSDIDSINNSDGCMRHAAVAVWQFDSRLSTEHREGRNSQLHPVLTSRAGHSNSINYWYYHCCYCTYVFIRVCTRVSRHVIYTMGAYIAYLCRFIYITMKMIIMHFARVRERFNCGEQMIIIIIINQYTYMIRGNDKVVRFQFWAQRE